MSSAVYVKTIVLSLSPLNRGIGTLRDIIRRISRREWVHVSAPDDPLTPQQRKILHLMVVGLTNREIADRLYLSRETVRVHVKNIYRRLGVTNRDKAVRWAHEHGYEETDIERPF